MLARVLPGRNGSPFFRDDPRAPLAAPPCSTAKSRVAQSGRPARDTRNRGDSSPALVDLLKKLAEVPDLAKLRVAAGGATPQRRRSLFQPTRAQELTAPQLDAAQQQLLNALTKAHQQSKPGGSRQGTPPVANAKPAPPLQPPPQQAPVQHVQPVALPQQLPQRIDEGMPQVPGAPEPPPRTPHGSLHGRQTQRDGYSFQQAMNDHFEQYRRERPPSRTPPHKADQQLPPLTAIYGGADCTPDSGVSESMDGDSSPTRLPGGGGGRRSTLPNMPTDEGSHHRAASLYVAAPRRRLAAPAPAEALTRKKSLPNIADAAAAPAFMSREEVSVLSSQRRDELRRMQEQAHRLRTNPLLYLFNSDVKDWFSRQQLVMLVLFINISLAIMFFKLLT